MDSDISTTAFLTPGMHSLSWGTIRCTLFHGEQSALCPIISPVLSLLERVTITLGVDLPPFRFRKNILKITNRIHYQVRNGFSHNHPHPSYSLGNLSLHSWEMVHRISWFCCAFPCCMSRYRKTRRTIFPSVH